MVKFPVDLSTDWRAPLQLPTQMSELADIEFVTAGGNCHPSAADWIPSGLAFGSHHNIAIWNPEDEANAGITTLLAGHTDTVNAVKFYNAGHENYLISGSADKTIRIWECAQNSSSNFKQAACLKEHHGSINTIAVLPEAGLFVSGASDGTMKIWQLVAGGHATLSQSCLLKPNFLPLATAITQLSSGGIVLAVAGTFNHIQIFVKLRSSPDFALQAILSGHEGWIRSLDFAQEHCDGTDDILLASASQDKYIRLWRFHKQGDTVSSNSASSTTSNTITSLSNKAHEVGDADSKYIITFEALLIGHEDWIYTARWAPSRADGRALTLLSASADNSLSIWTADAASGLWVCSTRLGEVSSQKGSTTATGSTGGFWIGLWQSDSSSVVSLGRTGSWRRWKHDAAADIWHQQVGISGHVQEVRGLAWSRDGSCLVSTSSDQTTRLWCQWQRNGKQSWHEFSRPQIHGYDLNCIDTIASDQFISGADEKLLRVFKKPKAVDTLLSRLCGLESSERDDLPDAANIPVLGLSNKAITTVDDDEETDFAIQENQNSDPIVHKSTLDIDHPPHEDHLARHTLWPEVEKLYGHGYEISTVCASHDGTLVATACKASSIDHATIRIYETREWREIKPPLKAHSLTVTGLAFSPDDRHLLSVGRDRQWSLFARQTDFSSTYEPLATDPKGHSRMILGCSWAPSSMGSVFATAGRDRVVKVWRVDGPGVQNVTSIPAKAAVTAIAFAPEVQASQSSLAFACEEGSITIARLDAGDASVVDTRDIVEQDKPNVAVNALKWRPSGRNADLSDQPSKAMQLAVASDDGSVRIYNVR
jgi:elongator complex protein 2